jgi:hypothetical protein
MKGYTTSKHLTAKGYYGDSLYESQVKLRLKSYLVRLTKFSKVRFLLSTTAWFYPVTCEKVKKITQVPIYLLFSKSNSIDQCLTFSRITIKYCSEIHNTLLKEEFHSSLFEC